MGTTTIIDSGYSPAASHLGILVAFVGPADGQGVTNIYSYFPFMGGMITPISVNNDGDLGNLSSYQPIFSPDDRYIAFRSDASNLVPGDNNNQADIFVYDGYNESLRLIPHDYSLLRRGINVAFSGDGRTLAYNVPEDPNDVADGDMFIRVSTPTGSYNLSGPYTWFNNSYNPGVSADGRYIAYGSHLIDLEPGISPIWGIYLHDTTTGNFWDIDPVIESNRPFLRGTPVVTGDDGQYIAFSASDIPNLVPGDNNGRVDVFLAELETLPTGERRLDNITRVSVASDGTPSNGNSLNPSVSDDGRYIAFQSNASNLVSGDTNGTTDVFIHDRLLGITTRASIASDGTQSNGPSLDPAINGDGQYVSFYSQANNLVPDDNNNKGDVFLYDRETVGGTVEFSDANYNTAEGTGGTSNVNHDVTLTVRGYFTESFSMTVSLGNPEGTATPNQDYENRFPISIRLAVDNLSNRRNENSAYEFDIPIHIIPDNLVEPNETINLEITDVDGIDLGSQTTTVFTIINDDYIPVINGTPNNDTLSGTQQREIIRGLGGNDRISGKAGNDILNGGTGNDTLNGGLGLDKYRFNSPNEGRDVLQNFNPIDDTVEVSNTGFSLPQGVLAASRFVIGTSALDTDDRFIYNPNNGYLFFDQDGSGNLPSRSIANILGGVNLTHRDIVVI